MSSKQVLIKDLELFKKIDPKVNEVHQNLINYFEGKVFLAGGYLRDLKFGKPFNDIDFFIEAPKKPLLSPFVEEDAFKVLDLEDEDGVEFQDLILHNMYMSSRFYIVNVIKQKIPFQLIFLAGSRFQSHFKEFNFNINQIFSTGKGVFYTNFFEEVEKKKTVSCLTDPKDIRQLRNYEYKREKLMQKYPEFSFTPINTSQIPPMKTLYPGTAYFVTSTST